MRHVLTATGLTSARFPTAIATEIEQVLGNLGTVHRFAHTAKSSVAFIVEHEFPDAEAAITELVKAARSTTAIPIEIAVHQERKPRKHARIFPKEKRSALEMMVRVLPLSELVGYTSDGYAHVLLLPEERRSRPAAEEIASVLSSVGYECAVDTSWSGSNFRYEVLIDYPVEVDLSDASLLEAGERVDFHGVLLTRDAGTGTITASVPSGTDFVMRTR